MPSVSKTSPCRGAEYLADQSFVSIRMDRTGQTTGVPMPELRYEHTGLWVVFAFRSEAILPKAGWRPESQPESRPESISLEARVLALLASAGPMSKSALSGALIANAFFRAGYIEAWGRGIEKIHRECREHDIPPPVFDYGMSGLMLTFRANPQHLIAAWGEQEAKGRMGEKVGEKVGEALTNNQRQILTLLRENPRMAAREVAQHIGISSRKVEQHIAKLKALTLLKRIGPAKGGYWQVTEDQREGM
jgi:hypothetical protein